MARVGVQIVVPLDPDDMAIGGIAAFVRGFVKHAPDDFAFELVGVTRSRQLGGWYELTLEGRPIRFLAVARGRRRRGGIPLAAAFTAGLLRYRPRIPAGRLQQFHRPGTALPLLSMSGPKSSFIHLPASALTSSLGESGWRRTGPALRLAERASLPRMDRIYVVSALGAAEYRRAYPDLAPRIRFVPNWVDDTLFAAPERAARDAIRAERRKTIDARPEDPIILFAGRLERQKDPVLAARASAQALAEVQGGQFVIAGEGTLRAEVEREIRALGVTARVHLLGAIERPALARWMIAADCLLITSFFEAGPTVGLEALATGLPVVTTPVGTIAGVVSESGCGAVVPDRSPASLAEAITALLSSDSGRLTAASLRAIRPYRTGAVLPILYEDARQLTATVPAGESTSMAAQ